MKKRNVLLGMLAAGLAHSAASAWSPDDIQLRINPGLTDIGVIKVDGEHGGTYSKITTEMLEYAIYVRGDRPPPESHPEGSTLSLWLDGGETLRSSMTTDWKKYTLTMPYQAPPDSSPIKLCNNRLQATSGARRQDFLKRGETFGYDDAYTVQAYVTWFHDPPGGSYRGHLRESMAVPVKIKCLALNRDRTQDGAPHRTTEPAAPLFWSTTLKVEPAKMVRDGRYICPSQLKLYGFVETGRKFQGKAIFMGPHYLSAITPLHFSYAGSRTVTATYDMKWKEIGGLTTTSDPKPKKQKLTFRFNISGQDGKAIESIEKTVQVSCSKIKPNGAAVGGGMTVAPAN